jgi:hypothetical protein
MKLCPYCSEKNKNDAIVCKHCGKEIEPTKVESMAGEGIPGGEPTKKKKKWLIPTIILGLIVLIAIVSIISIELNKAQVLKQEATAMAEATVSANSTATLVKQNELSTQSAKLITQTAISINDTATAQVKATWYYQATEKAKVDNLDRANLPAKNKMRSLGATVESLKLYSFKGSLENATSGQTNQKYGSVFTLDDIDGVCAMLRIRFNSTQRNGILYFEFFGPESSVVIATQHFDIDKSWYGAYLWGCIGSDKLSRGSYILSVFDGSDKVGKSTFTIK